MHIYTHHTHIHTLSLLNKTDNYYHTVSAAQVLTNLTINSKKKKKKEKNKTMELLLLRLS